MKPDGALSPWQWTYMAVASAISIAVGMRYPMGTFVFFSVFFAGLGLLFLLKKSIRSKNIDSNKSE